MKHIKWYADVDPDSFFPKCFNLADDDSFEEFIEYFKMIKAECILKKYLHKLSKGLHVDLGVLETALKVCRRRNLNIDEFIETKDLPLSAVTNEEWELLRKEERKFKGNENRIENAIN
jgi:hypothetical protein